ncbi:hypothetical protein MOQ72_01950 [Saccharopolyspora sp. K220]|nr:hypothetical protein [Saccharopolyspora soli]MCI2416173.1 hypothetical protein [Saccharopolyspora soli]
MSIRPPTNYRVSRWLLLVVFALAALATIVGTVTGFADVLTAVFNDG